MKMVKVKDGKKKQLGTCWIVETLNDQLWSHMTHRRELIYLSLLFKSAKLSVLLVGIKSTITKTNNDHEPDTVK